MEFRGKSIHQIYKIRKTESWGEIVITIHWQILFTLPLQVLVISFSLGKRLSSIVFLCYALSQLKDTIVFLCLLWKRWFSACSFPLYLFFQLQIDYSALFFFLGCCPHLDAFLLFIETILEQSWKHAFFTYALYLSQTV